MQPVSKKRTAIWNMHSSVHCSIIGTCLSSAEIRRLLIKLGVYGAESASDPDLHKQGVMLAGKLRGGAENSYRRHRIGATTLPSSRSPRLGMRKR